MNPGFLRWVIPVFCTAIGYDNMSPIQLKLSETIPDGAEMNACFDFECLPIPVEPDAGGTFSVPQVEPYLSPGSPVGVGTTGVYVEVRVDGALVAANRFGIETISDTPFWSRCPGPFHYGTVVVGG